MLVESLEVRALLSGLAPWALDDPDYATPEDTTLEIARDRGVLANDGDPEGDALAALLVDGPSHGAVTLAADGSFVYTPAPDWSGTDSFTYRATDGAGASGLATATITVHPVNDPPTAIDLAYVTNEDTARTVAVPGLLAGVDDVDGDDLRVTKLTDPSHGTVVLSGNGSFVYRPTADWNGTDSFVYGVEDGHGGTASATVTIVVRPVNDAPVAVDDIFHTDEDTPLAIPAPGLLANDRDVDGDAPTARLVDGPAHGTLSLSPDGSFLYTPEKDWNGTDSFAYRAHDGSLDSGLATVTVVVRPVNDAPTAVDDVVSTDQETPLTIAAPGVLTNDADVEGDRLAAVLVDGPAHGTLSLSPDGSFLYTPDPGFAGTDRFTYAADDGTDVGAAATVTIAVNGRPVAAADAYSVNQGATMTVAAAAGVLANDRDPEGGPLTALLVAGPSHGALTLAADGSFVYTPDAAYHGPDSFTYRASDGRIVGDPATVTITVVGSVSPAPIPGDDAYTLAEDTVLVVRAPGVLANDRSPAGAPLAAILETAPAHGFVWLGRDGSFLYLPYPNFHGADRFTYRIDDGTAAGPVATVSLTITPVNDPPIALPNVYATCEDMPLRVPAGSGVLANDWDAEGRALTAKLVSGPSHGALTLAADGSFVYTPARDWSGIDRFTYRASDGLAPSNVATVLIVVWPVDDAPLAAPVPPTTAGTAPASAIPGAPAKGAGAPAKGAGAARVPNPMRGRAAPAPIPGVATPAAADRPIAVAPASWLSTGHGLPASGPFQRLTSWSPRPAGAPHRDALNAAPGDPRRIILDGVCSV